MRNKQEINAETDLVLRSIGIQDIAELSYPDAILRIYKSKGEYKRKVSVEDKLKLGMIDASYSFLRDKIYVDIKNHMKQMDKKYSLDDRVNKEKEIGIKYAGKILYIKEKGSNQTVEISTSLDRVKGYEFFILGLIEGDQDYRETNAFSLELNYYFTFSKESKEEYNKEDIAELFKYNNSTSKKKIILDQNKKNELIKKEEDVLDRIIKDNFDNYIKQCNELKKVDKGYKEEIIRLICGMKHDVEDQDYIMDYGICRGIFNLALLDEYCEGREVYESEELNIYD